MTTEEFIEWAKQQDAAGRSDPMGYPWSTWKVAAVNADGTVKRDDRGRQVYVSQAEFVRPQPEPVVVASSTPQIFQMELFACPA